MTIADLRSEYHRRICLEIIRAKTYEGEIYYNFADRRSGSSRSVSVEVVNIINQPLGQNNVTGQTAGRFFEIVTSSFIENCFNLLNHIRPGTWQYLTDEHPISNFDQYFHLARIDEITSQDRTLRTTLGSDYIVKPDLIISKEPLSDDAINNQNQIVDHNYATFTPLRITNYEDNIFQTLHASISCKWTIRSDRAQNTRTEGLNLIRNRKGRTPHIVAVTAEPLPTRIAALALGTGDLDCVYHFALNELKLALENLNNEDQLDILDTMIEGRRLRDISDLPFDLAI